MTDTELIALRDLAIKADVLLDKYRWIGGTALPKSGSWLDGDEILAELAEVESEVHNFWQCTDPVSIISLVNELLSARAIISDLRSGIKEAIDRISEDAVRVPKK